MLKVVHVIGRMSGHGTQRQLAGMMRSAHGRHWDATLVVLRSGDALSREVAEAGIPVAEFGGHDEDPRRIVFLRRLLRPADVVHSSLWGANTYVRATVATLKHRPAVVVSERSAEHVRSAGRRMVDRALRTWTEEWIANSRDVAAFVAKAHAIPMGRVSVITNATDTSTFYPLSEQRADTVPAHLGTVGRLVPEKGLDVLLAAMPYVLSKRPVVLNVVGEGPERATLERRAEGLPVTFVGHLSLPSDVASFLRSIDVFVMPSRWEGLPNALLEALACGVPAVATDVPGMAEAAAGNAVLVPPDHPVALANAICLALDSGPRSAIAVRSFDEVAAAHAVVFRRARARLLASRDQHD